MSARHARLAAVLVTLCAAGWAQASDLPLECPAAALDVTALDMRMFIPNAPCMVAQTTRTLGEWGLWTLMPSLGMTLAFSLFLLKLIDSLRTGTPEKALGPFITAVVVTTVFLSPAHQGRGIVPEFQAFAMEATMDAYAGAASLANRNLAQGPDSVASRTERLGEQIALLVARAQDASAVRDQMKLVQANRVPGMSLNDPDLVQKLYAQEVAADNAAAKGMWGNHNWVFNIGYLLIFGMFALFAGIIWAVTLALQLNLLLLPLGLALLTVGNFKPVQYGVMTSFVTVFIVMLLPVVVALVAYLTLGIPASLIQPTITSLNTTVSGALLDYQNMLNGGCGLDQFCKLDATITGRITTSIATFGEQMQTILLAGAGLIIGLSMAAANIRRIPAVIMGFFGLSGGGESSGVETRPFSALANTMLASAAMRTLRQVTSNSATTRSEQAPPAPDEPQPEAPPVDGPAAGGPGSGPFPGSGGPSGVAPVPDEQVTGSARRPQPSPAEEASPDGPPDASARTAPSWQARSVVGRAYQGGLRANPGGVSADVAAAAARFAKREAARMGPVGQATIAAARTAGNVTADVTSMARDAASAHAARRNAPRPTNPDAAVDHDQNELHPVQKGAFASRAQEMSATLPDRVVAGTDEQPAPWRAVAAGRATGAGQATPDGRTIQPAGGTVTHQSTQLATAAGPGAPTAKRAPRPAGVRGITQDMQGRLDGPPPPVPTMGTATPRAAVAGAQRIPGAYATSNYGVRAVPAPPPASGATLTAPAGNQPAAGAAAPRRSFRAAEGSFTSGTGPATATPAPRPAAAAPAQLDARTAPAPVPRQAPAPRPDGSVPVSPPVTPASARPVPASSAGQTGTAVAARPAPPTPATARDTDRPAPHKAQGPGSTPASPSGGTPVRAPAPRPAVPNADLPPAEPTRSPARPPQPAPSASPATRRDGNDKNR